jgi:hypothetical protein
MLCLHVNMTDMAYVLMEQMRVILDIVVVHECGDLIVDAIFGTSETVFLGLLTLDTATPVEFLSKTISDLAQNLALCAVNLLAMATPPTAVVATFLGTLLDVANYVIFIKEDICDAVKDIVLYDAYSSLEVDQESQPGGEPEPCKIHSTPDPPILGVGSWDIYYHDSPMCADEPTYHDIWTFYEGGAIKEHWTGVTLDYTWQMDGNRITISETPSYEGDITLLMESDVSEDCWMMECGSYNQLGASWEIPTTYWRAERRY